MRQHASQSPPLEVVIHHRRGRQSFVSGGYQFVACRSVGTCEAHEENKGSRSIIEKEMHNSKHMNKTRGIVTS